MTLQLRVKRPVADSWPISARFGAINPKLWPDGPHRGTDFATPIGTPFYIVADGVVLQILKNDELLGNCLMVMSTDPVLGKFIHRYSHLLGIEEPISSKGIQVRAGQTGGKTGKTGHRSGAHLDFALKTWPAREPIEPIFDGDSHFKMMG